MVNWKTNEATDRLFAVLLAAHPGLKLEYQAMATLFGEGATYDSIENRFRRYRKMADEVKAEALSRGITELPRGRNGASAAATPRTPRGPRGGITKPSSSSSTGRRGKSDLSRALTTPTKRGTQGRNAGLSLMDAIFVDGEISEEETKVKVNNEEAGILSGIVGADAAVHDLTLSSTPAASSSVAVSMKIEDGEERGFKSAFEGAVKQEERAEEFAHGVGDVEVAGIKHEAFDTAGLHFPQGHSGYDMDDIYSEAA